MRGAIPVSHHLSITIRCLAARNTFEDPKFSVFPQPIGITVLETCLKLDTRTVNERILHNTDTAGTVRCATFTCLVLPYVTLVVETELRILKISSCTRLEAYGMKWSTAPLILNLKTLHGIE